MKKITFSFFISVFLLTFEIFSQIEPFTWTAQQSGTSNTLVGVYFINDNTGWVTGTAGIIRATTNSGVNWFPQSSGTTFTLYDLQFINSTTGLICGAGGTIRRTSNAGQNWLSTSSGVSYTLYSIHFSNSATGWIAGYGGYISKTTNSGLNWTIQSSGTTNDLLGIHFINENTGWAGGFAGTLIYTTNGGTNWSEIPGLFNTLNSVFFNNANTGWAVCNSGLIYFTTNNGINWITQYAGTNANYRAVVSQSQFSLPEVCYVFGSGGTIRFSTNYGTSWAPQISNTSNQLEKVHFINTMTGWAVGAAGTILKTTNGGITSLQNQTETKPENFVLYQNYPNPFNPSTKIRFSITPMNGVSERQDVLLKIYDILGHRIATLVNEQLISGTYEVDFDGSNYSSGIYYYTVTITTQSSEPAHNGLSTTYFETKKMVLLK